MFKLDRYGYMRDEQTGVWVRSDYLGIAYSDGDVAENKLAAIIRDAEDVSVLSEELPQHCTDWATLYHLSSTRGNILRPFEHLLKGKVLEIGAGCGAISRFLGECGAQLLSLEGSPRRASIAASRTRGLSNVTVLAERFDDFKTDEQFDAITLIGVLEYASMFSADADPAYAMLKRIRGMLKPDGHLFIAIENQLGLKYFAGAPEDHVSVPMYGIEGRYTAGQPKTFGRKELARLIERADFKSSTFLSPSPDYKLPNSIITEVGFNTVDFDAAALAWQNVKKDPQLPEFTHFNLEKAWPVVIDNDLGMELANSFLVAASCAGTSAIPETTLAYHYSTGRKAAYCKESLFVKSEQGIEVQYRRLGNEPAPERDEIFKYVLPSTDAYATGNILSLLFLDIASTIEWTPLSFSPFLKIYLNNLKMLLAKEGVDLELESIRDLLPGRYIDAVPHNIVINNRGEPSLIDVEWEMSNGVELGHLLMRALLLLLACANPLSSSASTLTRQAFIIQLLESVDLHTTPEDLDRYVVKEARFQEKVTGRSITNFLDWSPDKTIYTLGAPQIKPPYATLYYCNAQDTFSEEKTLREEVKSGAQTLVFPLAKISPDSTLLRFDPVDGRRPFSIDNMKIVCGGETVWQWENEHELDSGIVKLRHSDKRALYLSTNDDPYLMLPVDIKMLGSFDQLVLEIDFTLLMDEQIAQEIAMFDEIASKNTDSDLSRLLEQQLEAANANHAKLQESMQDQCGLLRASNDDLQQQLKAANSNFLKLQNSLQEQCELLSLNNEDLKRQLEASNTNHSKLQEFMQEQSEILRLNNEELELRRTAAALESELNEKDQEIQRLEGILTIIQIQKDEHIQNLSSTIQAQQNSASWKITSPLRKFTNLLRRLNKLFRLTPSAIKRGGGLKSTIKKAWLIWRQQGLAGLIARIRWFSGVNNAATIPDSHQVKEHDNHLIDRNDYSAWVKLYDTIDDNDRQCINDDIKTWDTHPLISIIMPVYNPPLSMLQEAVSSIQAQLYRNWQLCIADDASTNPEVLAYLKNIVKEDKRIRVIFRPENGHISHASNSALDIAEGQYIALMDNDDLLPEHSLYWVARTIVTSPDVAIIYSDEDKIDIQGNRSAPYFKTDWNLYLFRSHNMISHLGVYRRDLVENVGRFRVGMEGSQDYDLALRCIEVSRPEQIIHIPRVLYHWRIHAGSTAMSAAEKPYAQIAGRNALSEHLLRTNTAGNAELLDFGMYRINYDLPQTLPLVSLIIPTRNAMGLVKQCIDSIVEKTTYKNYEIILIDNGSDDLASLDYFESLKARENIRVIRDDGPFNYSALNNAAAREAKGQIIGLINNDIEVISPGWLDEMVSLALQPGAGAVGARLWYPDNRLQHGGVIMGPLTLAGHAHKFLPRGHHGYFGRASLIQGLSAVTAACLIIRKEIFDEVNGLNEIELKIAFNDIDFCLRVKEAGYQNIWTPNAELYHHESATRGLEDTPEKVSRFTSEVIYMQNRWKDIISFDPAYNPNLSFDFEDFSLSFPPRINKTSVEKH